MNTNNKHWINFDDVKRTTDFESVLDFYAIDFSGKGEQLTISCPFHREKTPSCKVNTGKKVFNCFGCGTGGNILEFIVLKEGGNPNESTDFRQAALKALEIMGDNASLSQKSNDNPDKSSKTSIATKNTLSSQKSQNLDDSVSKVNKVLEFALTPDPNHRFLKNRGLTDDQISEFGLGFQNRGMMKNRIVFPIHNEKNELIAYAGRWTDEAVPDTEMRYKLPQGFHKSLVLYNLNRVIKKHPETKHIVIVEGFWSTIRLHSAGVAAVSCMGTSVSMEQMDLLKEIGITTVTLMFDGDDAGRAGVEKLLPFLTQYFFVKTIPLNDGIKPDSMDEDIVKMLLEN